MNRWIPPSDGLGEGRRVARSRPSCKPGVLHAPPGSQLVIDGDGASQALYRADVWGAVVQEALELFDEGGTRVLEFGVSDEQAWDVGLACGGKVRVFLERLE